MIYFVFDEAQKKIDLTHLNTIFSEENDWFSNEFKSDMTFPVNIPIKQFADILDFDYNATELKKQFLGKLYRDGEVVVATLKLQKIKGKFIECILFFGLESFPGFNKKLTELDLEYIEDIEDMKTHALDIIVQNYPAVNYNFPMIHTDKYDSASEEFNLFQKIINNFSAGAFIENNLVIETNIDEIKNIMQPLPYLLHVMKAAVEESGYTLTGDILNIPDLQKALLFRDGAYFNSVTKDKIPFRYKIGEWNELAYVKNGIQHVLYNKMMTIEKKGDYLLYGSIFSVMFKTSNILSKKNDIFIGLYKISGGITTILFSFEFLAGSISSIYFNPYLDRRDIDIEVSFEAGDTLQITKIEAQRNLVPPVLEDYPESISLDLFPIRYLNPDGSPIISLLDLTVIDLKRVVPTCSVAELFMAVRLTKNLDFIVSGNEVIMNFIKPQFDRSTAIDLSSFDIEDPDRSLNDDRTYEIRFKDGKNTSYPFESIFIDSEGNYIDNYVIKKDTTPIEIDLLPLPIVDRDGVNTAISFEDDDSKIRLVFFNALDPEELMEQKPVCFLNHLMLIPAIYTNFYIEIINFFINSLTTEWEFIIAVEKFRNVNVKSLVYCYRNFHIFSNLERERLLIGTNQYWIIKAKIESLPLTAGPSS